MVQTAAASSNHSNSKHTKQSQSINTGGFWDIISNNEGVFMFIILIVTILVGIILTGLFQSGPTIRNNLLFNAAGAIGMAIFFIFIIFRFLGARIVLLGVTVDIGLIIYILIVCFVIFVLGG
jgi:hypothetical protein